MKCTAYSRAERSSPADGVSSCKQSPRLSLSSAALWFILSQEPVVCARRLRILRALIAFSCRQQLIKYRLFTTKKSCFFNAFLTHLRDFFLNRAWSLSSALGDQEYFVLSSPSLAGRSSMVYFVIGACRRRYCLFGFST